jgi:hypothetical protein
MLVSSYNRTMAKSGTNVLYRLLQSLWRPELPLSSDLKAAVDHRSPKDLLAVADALAGSVYTSPWQHFQARQIASLIKKYPFPDDEYFVDKDLVAWERLLATEAHGRVVNETFRSYYRYSPNEELLSKMRSFIRYVLGEEPNLDSILGKCSFGPGASIGVHGDATNAMRKILSKRWTVYPRCHHLAFRAMARCAPLAELLLRREGHYQRFYCMDGDIALDEFKRRLSSVDHNNIQFVLKDATTSRLIGIEAVLAGFVQKGFDLEMREHLKRVGFDLTDQARNRFYAQCGSESDDDEGFVTLDLKDASNCVFREPVRYLLPVAWHDALNACRAEYGVSQRFGKLRYELFASMGNGFCFPLETLLIAAACHAAGAGRPRLDYSVYGDDIVIRKRHVGAVVAALSVLGFSVNTKKSFTSGPFRESCGADYFRGIDVRPLTLDFPLNDIRAVFKFLNLTRRNSFTKEFFGHLDLTWFGVPPRLQYVRPCEGPPDTAVQVEQDQFLSSPFARWSKDYQAWTWMELLDTGVPDRGTAAMEGRDLTLLYGALQGASSAAVYTFRRKTKTKLRRVPGSRNAVKRPGVNERVPE